MSNQWNYPGARWWKFDFHTHTPASRDTCWYRFIGTPDELTPEKWLLKYMAGEIDCVAITDHNSGDWIDRLKEAYARMKAAADAGNAAEGFREIHIFPGVEISVNDGVRLLAIFDVQATTRTITDLLAKVGYKGTDGTSASVTADCLDVSKKIDEASGLTLPKHMEKGNATSFTWVKMASPPTLEGLRLALRDGLGTSVRRSDDSGNFNPFNTPEHFIESIEIQDARYMGRATPSTGNSSPALLRFSPYANAIIGGRGTGKSTVVHALRLAYGRWNELAENSESKVAFDRFREVADGCGNENGGLLETTIIRVVISRADVLTRLVWQGYPKECLIEESEDNGISFKPSLLQAITPQRFPVRLLSQDQITSLVRNSQAGLLQIIDEGAGIAAKKMLFEEARRGYFTSQGELRELERKLQTRPQFELRLADITRKLARFDGADHAAILKNYQIVTRKTHEIQRQFDAAATVATLLKSTAQQIAYDDLPEGLFADDADGPVLGLIRDLHDSFAKARKSIEEAAHSLLKESGQWERSDKSSEWMRATKLVKDSYNQLTSSLQQQGVQDPNEYGRLVQERQQLDIELKRLEELAERQNVLQERAAERLEAVFLARREITSCRSQFLESVLKANPHVRITVSPFGSEGPDIDHSLRDLLLIAKKDDYHSFSEDLYQERYGLHPIGCISDFVMNPSMSALSSMKEELINACRGESSSFSLNLMRALRRNAYTHASYIDEIRCWFPEDGLQVEYSPKGDGKDFRSINQASAGQRAAAMLAFLLEYGDEPLILDQPEDDLDNHLIYNLVVQQIQLNKLRRQLIIVTHNPNIVVNGDAELVHVLEFNHQCSVKLSGSLQEQNVRDEVCEIMEGGKEAFDRRYQRLGRGI